MKYHTIAPDISIPVFGEVYECDHPVYSRCTLFKMDGKGLAVIQQYHDDNTKHSWWQEIEPWIANAIYLHPKFREYFEERSGVCVNGLYPTVSVRQIMWALRMKPLKRQRWETLFDRREV
jgi:hypothetical protein